MDASEDSQLQAAIAASLTYTQSKNDCAEESSDEDDMGFSDSSSEGQPSPKKAPLAHRVNFKETVITSDEVFKPNGGSKSSTMGSCSKSPAAPTFIRSLDNAFKNEQSLGGGGNRVNDGDVNVEGGAQSEIDGMNSAAKPAAKSEKVTQESASSKEQSSLKSRYEKKAPDAQTSDSEVVAANVTDSRCSEAYKVEDASDGKGKQAKTEPDQNTVGNVQMDEQKGSCAENGMENQEETTSGTVQTTTRYSKCVSLFHEAKSFVPVCNTCALRIFSFEAKKRNTGSIFTSKAIKPPRWTQIEEFCARERRGGGFLEKDYTI